MVECRNVQKVWCLDRRKKKKLSLHSHSYVYFIAPLKLLLLQKTLFLDFGRDLIHCWMLENHSLHLLYGNYNIFTFYPNQIGTCIAILLLKKIKFCWKFLGQLLRARICMSLRFRVEKSQNSSQVRTRRVCSLHIPSAVLAITNLWYYSEDKK